MESITTAELVELAQLFRESVDAQFQYWLAATFAVFVATFLAREHFSKRIGIVVSFLYVTVTLVFFLSYMQVGNNYIVYMAEAQERGAIFVEPYIRIRPIRLFVIGIGTLTTLWFLNFSQVGSRDNGT